MSIKINNIDKHFTNFHALKNLSLDIKQGELITLLGPSGCGKTTLLRIIAGLEIADQGHILFNDQDITNLRANERNVGFVFQHYALFKHMTVFENIAFGLRVKNKRERKSKEQIKAKVHELLDLVQLKETVDRYPYQLSGGQRQRVALARTLAVEPKILLLDEPFGALDAKVRKELRRWLRTLHKSLNVTSIFVTHDQEEAFEVSDRIVIMNKGNIEQVGTTQEIIDKPQTPFVYSFLGHSNSFKSKEVNGKLSINLNATIKSFEETKIVSANGVINAHVRPYDFEVSAYKTGHQGIVVKLQRMVAFGYVAKLAVSLFEENQKELIDIELPLEDFNKLNVKVEDKLLINPKRVKFF